MRPETPTSRPGTTSLSRARTATVSSPVRPAVTAPSSQRPGWTARETTATPAAAARPPRRGAAPRPGPLAPASTVPAFLRRGQAPAEARAVPVPVARRAPGAAPAARRCPHRRR